MNQPPGGGPDPFATQPIPVTPSPPPVRGGPSATPGPFVHRFGNVPLYVLARFLAFAIDGFVVAFVIAAFAFNAFEPAGVTVFSQHDEGAFGTLAAASFAAAFAFAFVCEGLFGTSLGKSVFALHVRRADGGHAGVGRVFVRALLRPVDVFAVGPILALVTPRHQRLGDFAGGTVVSRSRIGPLASLIALALLGGAVYAQVVFGGGVTSALGVAAEAATFGPEYAAKAGALVGLAIPHAPVPAAVPLPAASAAPSATPLLAATPAPSAEPSGADASGVPEQAASAPAGGVATAAPNETPSPESSAAAPDVEDTSPPAGDASAAPDEGRV